VQSRIGVDGATASQSLAAAMVRENDVYSLVADVYYIHFTARLSR